MTRREREVTDITLIKSYLDKGKVIHLGLCDGDQPYVLPMNYGYEMNGEELTIYLHGATQGYKYEVIAKNPKVSFSIECDIAPFEGEVACQYGVKYSSVLGKGTIALVSDVEEKEKAMSLIMKTQTGKDFTFEERLVSIVNVLKITVTSYTAKHRPLPAALEEKH